MTDNAETRKHGTLLPNTVRAIICGPSNCGKTNILISLLESPHGLRFENVYVYSKSLQQPKYQYLEKLLTPIDEIGFLRSLITVTSFHQEMHMQTQSLSSMT